MKVVKPNFQLAHQRCPCICGGEGELVFETCPTCGHVGLFCAELSTFFPDVNAIRDDAALYGDSAACPQCRGDIRAYRPATTEEIERVGFAPGDYK